MMDSEKFGRFAIASTASLVLTFTLPAEAACNNPKNWFEAPGSDTLLFIGYKQDINNSVAVAIDGSPNKAHSIRLPMEMLGKSGTGQLSNEKTSNISYYEADGIGSWRVCRVEWWWPPTAGDNDADRLTRRQVTQRYIAGNTVLSRMKTGHMALHATFYYYDKKGRIERISEGTFERPDEPAVDKLCRRYDDKHRVTLAINPTISKVCPTGDPDPRDGWQRLKYGEFKGETVTLLDMMHAGKADGTWTEKYSPFRLAPAPDAPWGNAEADSKNGVTLIFGSNLGKLDDNVANTVVDSFGRWNGSTYTFTKPPVPVSILENPDLIYKYDRRRQTLMGGQIVKLYEFFKANENLSRHRYYMIDGYVLRHEQLDAKGKVTRVITIEDWRQPRPGPKPDVNDKLLNTRHIALLAHQVFHRVYDIDAAGKPHLVALSWNRPVRLNPAKKVPIDFADLVYGTPDGKERWKTKDEFEKAFNTSSRAAQVFPDELGKAR